MQNCIQYHSERLSNRHYLKKLKMNMMLLYAKKLSENMKQAAKKADLLKNFGRNSEYEIQN